MLCMDWITLLDLRIKSPPLLARLDIECNDDVVGFAEIEFVAYLQRRDLVSCLARGDLGPGGLPLMSCDATEVAKPAVPR